MALPTANITTKIVRNLLNEDTNNVGLLCISPNVNMWSKRKPVRNSDVNIAESDVGKTSDGWWGLLLPAYSGDDTKLTTYKKPRGGSSEPYRLGDFRGYYHNAQIPIVLSSAPDEIEKKEQTLAFIMNTGDDDAVGITDFDPNYRLGVMVYNSTGGFIGSASGVNGGDTDVTIDLSGLTYSTLTFKFCITDDYKPWGLSDMTALYELPRESAGQNQNWIDVPLIEEQVLHSVPTFNVIHDPFNDRLKIYIETLNYTGTVYLQFIDESSIIQDTTTYIILNSGNVYTFTYSSISWLIGGDTYTVRLWLDSTANGAFDAETTFTAVGSA